MTTPRVIHQMWSTSDLPEPFATYHSTVKQLNPDCQVILWTDADMFEFMEREYPDHYDTFRSYPLNIYRFDMFRYFLLYRIGGMYLDLDMEPHQPFNQLFADQLVLCEEHPAEWCRFKVPRLLSNAMMIAPPDHPFIKRLIDEVVIDPAHTAYGVIKSTGPLHVTSKWADASTSLECKVLSHQAFFPVSYNSKSQAVGTYATHRFAHTWWKELLTVVR